ncbi:hypothetical protein AB0E96_39380, partial [Kitasatospora sp. NPDC036755]
MDLTERPGNGTGGTGRGGAGSGGAGRSGAGSGSAPGEAGSGGAGPRRPGRIEVEIGELVLDGFAHLDHDMASALPFEEDQIRARAEAVSARAQADEIRRRG